MATPRPSVPRSGWVGATGRRAEVAAPPGHRPFDAAALDRSIAERFAQQVALHAERLAIRTARAAWTYGDVDRYADAVALDLAGSMVGAQERVAVVLGQEAPAVAALIGVAKAGHVAVPLDPRAAVGWRAILDDCSASALLAEERDLEAARALAGDHRRVLLLPAEPPRARPERIRGPVAGAGPAAAAGAPAVLLYTSGSSGAPKGVVRSHRAMLRSAGQLAHLMRLCPEDRVALTAAAHSGQGATTVFAALLGGAGLFPRDLGRDGIALADWLRGERLTVFVAAPSVLRSFVATVAAGERFPEVRVSVLGTELVLGKDVAAWRRHLAPGSAVVNCYGSTETSSLAYFVVPEAQDPGGVVPVGYPADDVEIVLVDDAGRPVAAGEVGQIVARSRYFSLGYWDRPAETARAFCPLADRAADEQAFFTGDLGRWTDEGGLEHLGRQDHRVKIHGIFVDLEDVAALLRQHPGVRDAVVTFVHPEPEGDGRDGRDGRLVAYWTPALLDGAAPPTAQQLREHVLALGGTARVPAALVMLDELPRTPTGKVDRRALPPPPPAPAEEPGGRRTPTEQQLSEIWARVLGVERVGVHDNFFELGGDSLKAMEIAELSGKAELHFPPTTLYEHPTIAELAERLGAPPDRSGASSAG